MTVDGADGAQTLVGTPSGWQAVADAMAPAPRLAIDLESDGFHRYPERVALIQLGLADGRIFLLDPLVLDGVDSTMWRRVLADPRRAKVMHSASNDLRALDRDFGWAVRGLFDTAVAAQLCGSRRAGLANVLEEHLGVVVDKPKRLQRLDWSERPLAADALEYAAGDVAHLLPLADVLAARLAALGRTSWADEECRRLEQVRFAPPESPQTAFLALPGARDLSDQGRAVLRELVVMREAEARQRGRPPYRVLSNTALLHLAEQPGDRLDRLPGAFGRPGSGARRRLEAALRRGRSAAPVPWPRPKGVNPWTPEARARLAALKGWRTREAARLDLDAGLIWPAAHLEQLALHPQWDPRTADRGEDGGWVRQWQWQELGPSLERQLAHVAAGRPAPAG